MNVLQSVTRVLRPLTRMRGGWRICKFVNVKLLRMGVDPLQVAAMRDGTKILIDLRSQTEWFSFYSGSYDDPSIAVICKLLTRLEGDFLDVGGNVGMYSVRVAAKLPAPRRSVCFEPMPANVVRILDNLILNKLSDRAHVYEIALSDREGTSFLVLREDFEMGAETGNASIAISKNADRNFSQIEVPTRRFDDVRKQFEFGKLPVAKVDIEGHEDFFLSGAYSYLHEERPIVFSEINNWFYEQRGTTSSVVFSGKFPAGYQVALIDFKSTKHTLSPCSINDLAALKGIKTCVFFPDERSLLLKQALCEVL